VFAAFAAFADEQMRRRWFLLPGSGASYRHEFRVGGGVDLSHLRGGTKGEQPLVAESGVKIGPSCP
jgi:hypothetical protein